MKMKLALAIVLCIGLYLCGVSAMLGSGKGAMKALQRTFSNKDVKDAHKKKEFAAAWDRFRYNKDHFKSVSKIFHDYQVKKPLHILNRPQTGDLTQSYGKFTDYVNWLNGRYEELLKRAKNGGLSDDDLTAAKNKNFDFKEDCILTYYNEFKVKGEKFEAALKAYEKVKNKVKSLADEAAGTPSGSS